MLTLNEIKSALHDRRPAMVAKSTGVSCVTIANIRDGINTNPTLSVMQRLSDYLEGVNHGREI